MPQRGDKGDLLWIHGVAGPFFSRRAPVAAPLLTGGERRRRQAHELVERRRLPVRQRRRYPKG